MKAELPADEAARLAALRSYDVLDRILQPELEDIVRLSTAITGASAGVVNLIDVDRQWQVCAVGMEAGEVGRDDAMCAHAVLRSDVLHVPDSRLDARFADNPFVDGRIARVRMYASAPLVTLEGEAIGTICNVDERAYELTDEQLLSLQALARQVMTIFELRRRSADLEHRNADLDAFAGVLAHDLRSPLTAIAGYAELLASEVAGAPEQEVLVEQIEEAASRMHRLITGILAYSRSDRGPYDYGSVPLAAAAADAVANLRTTVERAGATVSIDAPGAVWADPAQLVQLVQNLVANAVAHAPAGRAPVVRVRSSRSGPVCRLVVEDNGKGIDVDQRERIFERFARGTTSAPGFGLGLATCKRIAERHGASIKVVPSGLGGAAFEVVLPLADPATDVG